MDRVTNKDIPLSLSDRLDSVMRQRAEESRRLQQEKTFKTYKYVTEENIRDFHGYKRDADFISLETMSTIKIMDGCTYVRLYISIADRLNLMPCDIRLWFIENGEKTLNLRVGKLIDLENVYETPIDHNRFYVQELKGNFCYFLSLFLIFSFFSFFLCFILVHFFFFLLSYFFLEILPNMPFSLSFFCN